MEGTIMGKLQSFAMKPISAIALILPLASMSAPALAQDITHNSKFRISFLGLNIGTMKSHVKISKDRYEISGGARSNPLVSIVANAKAHFASSGEIADNKLVPSDLSVSYRAGKKSGRLKMGYDDGGVASIESKPKIKYKPGTVPIKKAHLQQVIDPVSSLLFPVKAGDIGDGRKVCNRVLPVFDGRSRMNLVFSYKSSQSVRVKGFAGQVHTCLVRYQPVSGIRPKKKNIKFMKANRDMQVTMAQVGNTKMYALFAFRVRTEKGMASGKAYEFTTN
jgi:hypothetical protein